MGLWCCATESLTLSKRSASPSPARCPRSYVHSRRRRRWRRVALVAIASCSGIGASTIVGFGASGRYLPRGGTSKTTPSSGSALTRGIRPACGPWSPASLTLACGDAQPSAVPVPARRQPCLPGAACRASGPTASLVRTPGPTASLIRLSEPTASLIRPSGPTASLVRTPAPPYCATTNPDRNP